MRSTAERFERRIAVIDLFGLATNDPTPTDS
jgi:hypothetical protein